MNTAREKIRPYNSFYKDDSIRGMRDRKIALRQPITVAQKAHLHLPADTFLRNATLPS